MWLLMPFMGIGMFYALILVHCCAHESLVRSKLWNKRIGTILSALNFFDFKDFQYLHLLHHSHSNCPERDPHHIRPGETWLHYVLTHYLRLFAYTYTPHYRRVFAKEAWKELDLDSRAVRRHDLINKMLGCSGRIPRFGLERIVFSLSFGYLFITLGPCWIFWGWAGIEGYVAVIILPWAFAQVLVADFNWRGHVGLPPRSSITDYRGEDTRSLYGGPWRFINWATFGFYLHREHHLDPKGACLFTQADEAVRLEQSLERRPAS